MAFRLARTPMGGEQAGETTSHEARTAVYADVVEDGRGSQSRGG